MKTLVQLLFICFAFSLSATNLKPWFENEYEVVLRADLLYQTYRSLSTAGHQHFKSCADDLFLTLSAEYPFKRYSGEFEATAANTRHQNRRWDNFRLTGRYQLYSEDIGDKFTLTAGIILTEPFKRALHDISSFHHGYLEAEANLAIGKKYGDPCGTDFKFRWWGVLGFAIANKSYPWVRADAACEYKINKCQICRAFVHTFWGTGKRSLHPQNFKGYGQVHHQSIDLGLRYSYRFYCYGSISLQYARRIYAHNFPEKANLFLFEYKLPFGSQVFTNY